jgi:hypothetical protein
MKSSTLLRKEAVIPAFAVSLILVFAFVMPGNAFRSNGDQQCGYGYGYSGDNEDQQGDQNDNQQGDENGQGCEVDNENDNEIGNTSEDDNLSGSDDKGDISGDNETGGTHVASLTKKAVVVHTAAPTTKAPVHTESGDGDGDQPAGTSGGDGGGDGGGDQGGD